MVRGWNIIEEPSYKRAVILLGGAEACDEALAVVTYALHRSPIGFPPVPNVRGVYLAKTKDQDNRENHHSIISAVVSRK
jgi:hypothetical protein